MCLTLSDPRYCSPPGSSAHGILQARIPEWIVVSTSRGTARLRDRRQVSCVSCLVGGFFTAEPLGKRRWFIIASDQTTDVLNLWFCERPEWVNNCMVCVLKQYHTEGIKQGRHHENYSCYASLEHAIRELRQLIWHEMWLTTSMAEAKPVFNILANMPGSPFRRFSNYLCFYCD